jgi:hypothetical protein
VIIRTYAGLLGFLLFASTCTPATSGGGDSPGGAGGARPDGSGGSSSSGGTGGRPGTGGAGGSAATSGGSTGGSGTTSGGTTGGSGETGGSGGGAGGAGGSSGSDGAAAPDAPASGDGGAAGNPASCAGKFCDDFEAFPSGAPPAGAWTTYLENNGKLSVDETRAWSGARSVHFTHQGSMSVAMFMELRKPLLPLATPVTYGRLMYWLNKNPTGKFSHFEIVRGTGPLPGGATAQLNTGAQNGKGFINYEPGDCSAPATDVPFPEGKWACYQFAFDGTKNQITEWVEGKIAVGPTTPKGLCWKWPMAVDTLHIGWESYHTPVLIDLWIDDVAVGDQPIPCPTGMASKP